MIDAFSILWTVRGETEKLHERASCVNLRMGCNPMPVRWMDSCHYWLPQTRAPEPRVFRVMRAVSDSV